jgi:tetratricopeptide (TPR) repeat protein
MEPTDQNELNFLDLLVAIETSKNRLSLLIAVCDRDRLRISLTERYEQELAAQNIQAYRVAIDRQDPSLFAAMNKQIESEPNLKAGNHAVITIEGVASLSNFASEGSRSPLDIFLGYLQWTREGMRQFPFPIVIWVTEHIHNEISRKAPDFYSWRQGVFFFESEPEPIVPIHTDPQLLRLLEPDNSDLDLPIDELLKYIAQLEIVHKQEFALATLYSLLAKAYERDKQIIQAIGAWEIAIKLQQNLNLSLELATSLNHLALLYDYQGKYTKAEPLFKQSLEIRERQLGIDHPDVADSLNNLALLYEYQDKYSEAEPLLMRSLKIWERQLGVIHPFVAASLNNLAELYRSQGKYSEAEPLYLRSLEIWKRQLGNEHSDVAKSLNNLAKLYKAQGKYSEAEQMFMRSLKIREQQLGTEHSDVASSLNNLATLYEYQGKYSEAEQMFTRSLEIWERQLGSFHPLVATGLNNLAGLYGSQGKYNKAEPLYLRAISILEDSLGKDHPRTLEYRNNLQLLREFDKQDKGETHES